MERLITPALLRLAQTYLDAGGYLGSSTYCCHAVADAAGETSGGSLTAYVFEQNLRDWGFLPEGRTTLPFFDEDAQAFPPDDVRQGARFMLLELLALALEDGCLE